MKTSRTFWSVARRHSVTSRRAERERDVHNVRMIPDAGMDDVDNSNGESGIGTFLMSLVMTQCQEYVRTFAD